MARAATSPADGLFTLLGDQPHVTPNDPLGFDKLADDLTSLVLSSRVSTPFTLGIEAGWGMGKSSLMRRLETRLKEHDVKTVWFNAWTAGEEDVLEGLVKSVLYEIDPNILRRAARNAELMGWLRLVATVIAGWLHVGGIVEQLWRRVEIDPKARNEMRSLMVDAMERWRDKAPHDAGDRLLVVFIDDLDRCSPANVFQVFEAIKLYLDAAGFVFVIGFDRGIISESILEQKRYSKSVSPDDYLEKIIQIGYRIPRAGDEEAKRLLSSYLESSRTAELFESSAQSLVIERNASNPRRIKRFVNGFILEYGLDQDWEALGAETLVKVLILYMYFPDFARLLDERTNEDPFTEFLDYCDVRGALRRRVTVDSEDWPPVARVLEAHGLAVPTAIDGEGHAELLKSIEEELPESFSRLAAEDDFVSLVGSFGGADDRQRLRHKLERRLYVPGGPAAAGLKEAVIEAGPSDELGGLDVLWIDDRPDSRRDEMDLIRSQGAQVATVTDFSELAARLAAHEPDLLISDIARGDEDEAGFRDLERLRAERTYSGPVAFFTTRLTPARRRAAEDLDAQITDDPWDLVRIGVEAVASKTAPTAPARKAARRRGKTSVFIVYRREESAGYAGRLYDALAASLGEGQVFLDVDMAPGANFVEALRDAVAAADIFLVLIGPRWLSATEASGQRLIDDPNDYVRLTLATALSSEGGTVIPVLIQGARMPAGEELPKDIASLVRRNAIELSDSRWRYDLARLMEILEELSEGRTARAPPSSTP